MIVVVRDLETNEKEAYLNIQRIASLTEINEKLKDIFLLEGFNKNMEPRAKAFSDKYYKVEEVRESLCEEQETMVKDNMGRNGIRIYDYLENK